MCHVSALTKDARKHSGRLRIATGDRWMSQGLLKRSTTLRFMPSILTLESWTLHLYCSKLITFVSIEQHYVYNFHRSWMADNNKFMLLVSKVSFILNSTIIDRISYNLLSINKWFPHYCALLLAPSLYVQYSDSPQQLHIAYYFFSSLHIWLNILATWSVLSK